MANAINEGLLTELASKYTKDGDVISVGTSPHSLELLKKVAWVGQQHKRELFIVPTSKIVAITAEQLKLELVDINEYEIDTAFEFVTQLDQSFNFIKSESTSLIRDKMIAQSAAELLAVCPAEGFVPQLNAPVPFEIVPFGWKRTINALQKLGPAERRNDKLTESGNFLADVHVDNVYAPDEIEYQAHRVPDVIETGLFINYTDRVLLWNGGIKVLSRMDYANQNDTTGEEEIAKMLF